MTKRITDSQILGELGETAVKKLVLEMQFVYDPRGRLEAGTDGIIELRDPNSGAPLGKLLGVQVKATGSSQYVREPIAVSNICSSRTISNIGVVPISR
jgi:Domain of unknown function (DUF4365)